jgi:transposase
VTPEESQTLQGDLTARRLKKELQSSKSLSAFGAGNANFPMSMRFLDLKDRQ